MDPNAVDKLLAHNLGKAGGKVTTVLNHNTTTGFAGNNTLNDASLRLLSTNASFVNSCTDFKHPNNVTKNLLTPKFLGETKLLDGN
jgi:hypothetical protein